MQELKPRKGPPLSFDEDEAMALWLAGKTDMEMARTLGVGRTVIGCWRIRRGLEVNPAVTIPDCMELYEQGMTDSEIANALGIRKTQAYYWRKKQGLPFHPSRVKTAAKVREPKPYAAVLSMTDGEIRRSWRGAVDQREQVKILAELNACPVEQMQEKLAELGCLQEVDS